MSLVKHIPNTLTLGNLFMGCLGLIQAFGALHPLGQGLHPAIPEAEIDRIGGQGIFIFYIGI